MIQGGCNMFFAFIFIALLRIAFYAILVAIGLYIYKQIRIYKKSPQKKYITKIGGCICVFLCLCFLGLTEPEVKPRIDISTIENMYIFLEQNESNETYCDFDVGYASGYTGFIDENTFKNKQRDLFKYGEIDGIEIYYKPYKCYRWDTTTHLLLPFDFFGVPDAAEAAELYLVCKDKVGYIYLDYNPYNLGMVFSGIVHPLFVYRPMINFDEIISSITDKRQSSNQGTAGGSNQGDG